MKLFMDPSVFIVHFCGSGNSLQMSMQMFKIINAINFDFLFTKFVQIIYYHFYTAPNHTAPLRKSDHILNCTIPFYGFLCPYHIYLHMDPTFESLHSHHYMQWLSDYRSSLFLRVYFQLNFPPAKISQSIR